MRPHAGMEGFVLVALLVVGGWVLGILGFFQARAARREVAELRALLARGEVPAAEAAPAEPPASPFAPRGSVPEVGASEVPPPLPAEAQVSAEAVMAEPPPLPPPPGPKLDIESLLTLRWGVWLGSAALVLAGVFLVRYAIDEGLLGPAVRCFLAVVLGAALLGGAEWLRRHPAGPEQVADHAPAGLAAGGVAVLFGAAYAAGVMYGLVPPLPGFALMAAAALVGMVASLRFGRAAGLVAVAAAFASPALVETATPWAPGLFAYLLFVTAAACAVVRFSAWAGLGWIATVAGAGWVLIAATGGLGGEYWAPGLFVPAAAALHLLSLPRVALAHVVGRRLSWVPFLALGLAGVGLSGEVADLSVRAGVLLLAPLSVLVALRTPVLDRLPWLAAGLGLLLLLVWAMPGWEPTGETISIEGAVQAFLPGAWAPEVIRPLLFTAAGVAGFFAAVGLVMERWAARPVRWAGLVAAVPVLALGLAYLQVARFQADLSWALVGLGLAAGLVGAAAAAMRERSLPRAGAHAAGAVAALCFAFAVLLHDQWVTLAVALMLPPLAWIEARTGLAALRRVALAVAGLVLVRLLGNWYVLDYGFGATPVLNGLWLAYAVPAGCFALAARMFLRRGDDLTVAVLEGGAVAFASVFVALQIRHAQGLGQAGGGFDAASDLLEVGLHVSALGAQGLAGLFLARRSGRPVLAVAWRIQGALAWLGGAMLLVGNPITQDMRASQAGLAFAYLVPAGLAGLGAMQPEVRRWLRPLGIYALLAGFAWLTLEVRLLFHPGARLGRGAVLDAEMWAFSGAWLGYGVALMAGGIAGASRMVRLAALAVIAVVVGKVFLFDMAELDGLWRVLSFLGLGLALIGLGAVFRRFVVSPAADPGTPAAPP